MFKNYFKVGLRNLMRNRGYSAINIGGLAAGMAVAILIGLWVYDELSFNKSFPKYTRIVQAMKQSTINGHTYSMNAIPLPLEAELRNSYGSDFKMMSICSWTGEEILASGDHKITKFGNYFQKDFPEILDLQMIAGDRQGLKDPGGILLSRSTAKAMFGNADPMNQSMTIGNRMDVKVAGVYEDLPANSAFKDLDFMASWDMLYSKETWMKRAATQWGNNSFQLFVALPEGVDLAVVNEKIKKVVEKNKPNEKEFDPIIFLHPMKDWHLRSDFKEGKIEGGAVQLVIMIGTIGFFVLMLACINFMNLSTARSEKRSKEVGIRMTIRSVRSQLIKQFLSESFLVVILAFVVSLLVVWITLPAFNKLSDKSIVIEWTNPYFIIASLLFVVITSFVSGSYPALYLSSFRPVNVLKGTFRLGRFASLPRKILVVVQFTVSIALVIGTVIIYQQVQYTKNRPVGYDRQGLIMLQMRTPEFYASYNMFRDELKRTGAVDEFAESGSPMTGVWSNSGGFEWEGKDPNLQTDFGTVFVSHDFGATVKWKIKEGRDFSRDVASDSTGIILNESAAKFMKVKNPVGMVVKWNDYKLPIIGIVDDLIMSSPYTPAKPTVFLIGYTNTNWMNIRLNPAMSAHDALKKIEDVFAKLTPAAPFEYKFVDDEYAQKFSSEERVGKLALVFAALAILISCLGLTGLASFVAEQRTKEIGIRKVLGASVGGLWQMLSQDFVILVLISCFVASPISFFVLSRWVGNYQYQVPISYSIFIITALGAIFVTLITVSFQAIRAATMNPVRSLRSE